MCTRDMNHSGRNAPMGSSASLGSPSRARISAKCSPNPVSAVKQMEPDGVSIMKPDHNERSRSKSPRPEK
jgi:hypothetical protein